MIINHNDNYKCNHNKELECLAVSEEAYITCFHEWNHKLKDYDIIEKELE